MVGATVPVARGMSGLQMVLLTLISHQFRKCFTDRQPVGEIFHGYIQNHRQTRPYGMQLSELSSIARAGVAGGIIGIQNHRRTRPCGALLSDLRSPSIG